MKITPADSWFSKCVRHAAKWTCERCGRVCEEGSRGLHASHIFPRTIRALRWCKDNLQCLCYMCHKEYHEQPTESAKWVEKMIGKGMLDILREKKNQLVKVPKTEEKEIAKHYKKEYERMVKDGSFEFESWQ